MLPILPILILLLLGSARADRLAVEGRLPAALLAAHAARVAPLRATVVAPVEDHSSETAVRQNGPPLTVPAMPQEPTIPIVLLPACPPRAGPRVA